MNKILIIKTHAIGDVLMATPAIRELKKAFPGMMIDVLVGKWSEPVLKNNPYINEIISFDDSILFRNKFIKLLLLLRTIRKKNYQIALILHPSPFIHLLAFLAGIKQRIGLRRNKRGWFLTKYVDEETSPNYYYPKNFLHLLSCLGIKTENYSIDCFYSEVDKSNVENLLTRFNISSEEKKIIIAAGGSHNPKETISARLWPYENYISLINKIKSKFPEHRILLCGSRNDSKINFYIEKNTEEVINLTNKTSLTELAYLIRCSEAVICNDSSILHIALSQKVPVLCFFGPTSLSSRIPESYRQFSIQSNEKCSPCYKYAIFPGCSKNMVCMSSITPNAAFEKAIQMLNNR